MKLLLVEDDRTVRIPVRDALEEHGFSVVECADGTAARRAIESASFDIVLTDVRLPGMDGVSLLHHARALQPDAAVVLMTAYAQLADAVAVMRDGARDYIVKPFEMDELILRLGRLRTELEFRDRMRTAAARPAGSGLAIHGTSPAAQRLVERIDAAAASDVSVLILGETGTGKELCARLIHQGSRRSAKPLIAVNCAAIPENLLESELFGHEKGAFTGAVGRRVGRFEAANGGTLLLDEVGDLPLSQQAKLLRVLETGTFEPVGSSHAMNVDVRILAATHRDLAQAAASGAFRSDLFYRLNVIDVHTPPLRERRGDIPALVQQFLVEICARQGSAALPALEPGAVAALATYDFPGNVRELIHALERAVALSRGAPIRLEHLPPALARSAAGRDEVDVPGKTDSATGVDALADAVGRFEREYIQRVLDKVDGHRGRAASLLGISRKSLWQRLKGVDDKPE